MAKAETMFTLPRTYACWERTLCTHIVFIFFWLNSLTLILFNLNPFHANALFCYPYVKKPEIFYCFQGLWKFNIGLNWVN